jgi:acyl-CoA reductase-like NAD-dependent aldehyde dehydrogenase
MSGGKDPFIVFDDCDFDHMVRETLVSYDLEANAMMICVRPSAGIEQIAQNMA